MKKFNNMKIGKKLIIGFVLVTIISSIAGVVGLVKMMNMDSSYTYALNNYGFAQGDIGLFHAQFNHGRTIIRDIVFETDSDTINTYAASLKQSNAKMDIYFAKMKNTMVNETELKHYNDISDNLTKFRTASNQVVVLAKQNKGTEAQALMAKQCTPLSDKIRVSLDELISENTTIGDKISENLTVNAKVAYLTMVAIIVIALVISLIIALVIARGISNPVKEMAAAAQEIAKGNLGVQINVDSKDEIGQLGTALAESTASTKKYINDITWVLGELGQGNLDVHSKMYDLYAGDFIAIREACVVIITSLNDTLSQINQASEQVSSGSEQVSNGAQALAQGATEQASSIEELSASITEISTQVKDNATHATNASMNVNQVSSEMEISNKHMEDMVAAMTQINESSNRIGKIIKAIEDIAFQTNILALNAAVEAARAGKAGKGFAVVADEVRNLASKSAAAAKDTTVLIENCVSQIENGTRIADETSKSLLKVVESTKNVANDVDEISTASSQQADSIGQVESGVEQISSVVQTNSATAEESAAASEELSGQAQILKELVDKFKLRNQTNQNQNTNSESQQSENTDSEPQQSEDSNSEPQQSEDSDSEPQSYLF